MWIKNVHWIASVQPIRGSEYWKSLNFVRLLRIRKRALTDPTGPAEARSGSADPFQRSKFERFVSGQGTGRKIKRNVEEW